MKIRFRESSLHSGRTCVEYVKMNYKETGLTVECSGLWETDGMLSFEMIGG